MKVFNTNNIEIVKCCQREFCFSLPSVTWARRNHRVGNYSLIHFQTFTQVTSPVLLLSFRLTIIIVCVFTVLYKLIIFHYITLQRTEQRTNIT